MRWSDDARVPAAAAPSSAPARRPGPVGAIAGVIGELMITAGLLVAAFLVWQFVWTDVVAQQGQDRILAELDARWSASGGGASDGTPVGDGTAGDGADGGEGATRIAPERTDAPPVVPVAPENETFGEVIVPRFARSSAPLAEGVTNEGVLDVIGAGHYPGTAMPGEVGNVAIAGHRTTYGKPFHDVAELRVGDAVVIRTADAYFVYTVTGHEIVAPEDVDVIAPVPGDPAAEPTERMLTLTTCHPMYSARQRYVVHARFAYWTASSDGIPPALAGTEPDGRGA
ncbi:class E sortase [Brachybacterium huguangmaarense]